MIKISNKWTRAVLPALLIHTCIGTVYCWSVFKADVANYIGTPLISVEWSFSLAIFFLGISAAFAGKFIEHNIKQSALLSCAFFIAGLIITALGIGARSFWLVLLGYGFLQGIGLGIGYLTPVKNLTIWFKTNPGVATGIAIAGFGIAKTIYTPVIESIIDDFGIQALFYILAGIFALPMLFSVFLIKRPTDYIEEKNIISRKIYFKDKGIVKLWIIFYLNISCGLALISQEKNLLSPLTVAAVVVILISINALVNCLGRLTYSSLSDFLERRENVYRVIFVTEIAVCIVAAFFSTQLMVVACVLIVINFGYGGGFSSMPAVIKDYYGAKNLSSIHGVILSAWAIAGLTGNQLSAIILHNFNQATLYIILAILYSVALFVVPKLEKRA